MMVKHGPEVEEIAAARRRVAIRLSAVMVLIYFGFIAVIAYRKDLLAAQLVPGLTLGILLGALVIVSCWVLTWIYIRWANREHDPHLDTLRKGE